MGFFKKIANLFSSMSKGDETTYWLNVQCDRCGEKIRARVHLYNDLSIRYGQGSEEDTYFSRKTIIGDKRCFQPIEVEMVFDRNRRLIERRISGGKFLSEEDGHN
jgi:hypothetical protein